MLENKISNSVIATLPTISFMDNMTNKSSLKSKIFIPQKKGDLNKSSNKAEGNKLREKSTDSNITSDSKKNTNWSQQKNLPTQSQNVSKLVWKVPSIDQVKDIILSNEEYLNNASWNYIYKNTNNYEESENNKK